MHAKNELKHGPDIDSEFFDELHAVFQKFPDVARKYAIRSTCLEDYLGKDMKENKKVYRIEGDTIIAEIRAGSVCPPSHFCCEWVDEGSWRCLACCPAFP
ncbi:hypothetical protein [Saccharopolyspora sp. 5N708]|uniref:hypothetical protein n=1 Tax=Saccharopolyspora sp. 5N708 TaxID=3457424 RepID=UPI003FD5D6E8